MFTQILRRKKRGKKSYSSESYYLYLQSEEWDEERNKAAKKKGRRCLFCHSPEIEWHHLSYDYLWTTRDHLYIIPACRVHHHRLHFTVFSKRKIPLIEKELRKRYRFYKLYYPIGELRPSSIFNLFSFMARW